MVFLHDVLDLVEIFLGEFVAIFENGLDLVVNSVEGVEVFLLEVPLLGLVSQQRYLVGDLLVVLHCNFDSPVVQVEELKQFEGHFAVLAFVPGSDILIFTVPAHLFLLKVTIGLHCVYRGGSFHIAASHSRHLFLLVFFFVHIFFRVLVVESYRLEISVVNLIIKHLTLFCRFLFGVRFDVLHDLRQDLLFDFFCVVGGQVETGH